MTDELKPCPFCGSPARLNRSTGESLWSHDQVEWTQVQCTNEDCGVATENRCEGWEPTPIESWNTRALTAAQPAQAEQVPEGFALLKKVSESAVYVGGGECSLSMSTVREIDAFVTAAQQGAEQAKGEKE